MLHRHHAKQQGLGHWCDIFTLTHLQLDKACGIFLVIQPLVILKGGNLLIIEAVGRFAAHDNCVALQQEKSQPALSCAASLKQPWPYTCSGAQGLQLAQTLLMSQAGWHWLSQQCQSKASCSTLLISLGTHTHSW